MFPRAMAENRLRHFLHEERGASAVDAAVLLAGAVMLAASVGLTVVPAITDVAERATTETAALGPGGTAHGGSGAGGGGGAGPDEGEDAEEDAPAPPPPDAGETGSESDQKSFWSWVIGWLFG